MRPAPPAYAYDAEGRVSGEGQWVIGNTSTFNPATTYIYDADGSRVAKTGSSAIDYIEFGGRQLARLSGGQWTDLIYGVSGLLAEVPGTQAGTPVYRMLDHLGSVAGTLNSSGTLLSSLDYAPFGQIFAGGTADPYVFTGKERDAESGLDNFGARYFGSSMGRFMSPDPLMASAHPENPQSWNRYAYALNNPLSIRDVDGLYPSPAFNCDKDHKACLNDDQRRILNNSNIKVGDKTLSGEALWNAIGGEKNGEALQNSFVNRTDGLSAIKFADGKSAISFVSSITDIHQDRIFANVGSGLADELAHDSRFGTVSASLHAEGGYNALSYKSNDYPQGNIQFSFNAAHTGADIDHDLYMPGVMHLFSEVIPNHLTGGLTNQDSVRQMLIKNPNIGLTPSPDPKWNRP